MRFTIAVNQLSRGVARPSGRGLAPQRRPQQQVGGDQQQENPEDYLEKSPVQQAGQAGADNCRRHAGQGKQNTGTVVDAPEPRVGEGAGHSVKEDNGERNAGDNRRAFPGIKEQQDGHQDKAARRPDERAKDTHEQPDESE